MAPTLSTAASSALRSAGRSSLSKKTTQVNALVDWEVRLGTGAVARSRSRRDT